MKPSPLPQILNPNSPPNPPPYSSLNLVRNLQCSQASYLTSHQCFNQNILNTALSFIIHMMTMLLVRKTALSNILHRITMALVIVSMVMEMQLLTVETALRIISLQMMVYLLTYLVLWSILIMA